MSELRQKAVESRAAVIRHLEANPELKAQLIKAEKAMYDSWLEHEGRTV